MSVNFFETDCKESSRNEKQFGICDDQDGAKAYTDTTDNTKWIAKVTNDNEIDISFTAIDNCIIVYKEGTKEKESSCDGMLTFAQSLYLVELKKQSTGGWIADAKGQLENTIQLLSENHDLSDFRFKKAFACNRKHPNFTVIDTAERKSFFERTNGFRIDVQAEIVIK
ncbi:MAG TPA: hypothetical protein PLJ37_08910 [Chitinophagales bacterium]|nr:hypothetical protein [Chitinophagales bacterium]HMW94774.1 hypothetical protein [Chitinophagales bacterium]HMY42692.1 hypothetical protein [Chitinophagales bacterium]HMZ94268.1 hypothetical protein [Chitinophagales bacterium]HNB39245.1 hypothetical protein [Chitinophagales bacterium]